jgi:hypothetical protein
MTTAAHKRAEPRRHSRPDDEAADVDVAKADAKEEENDNRERHAEGDRGYGHRPLAHEVARHWLGRAIAEQS